MAPPNLVTIFMPHGQSIMKIWYPSRIYRLFRSWGSGGDREVNFGDEIKILKSDRDSSIEENKILKNEIKACKNRIAAELINDKVQLVYGLENIKINLFPWLITQRKRMDTDAYVLMKLLKIF